MHDHDALFRSIFAEPRHAASLLRGLFPADITRFAAWETLQMVPGTFIDPSLRHRQSDLLFTLQVAGQTMLIYLLLEHKSAVDRWTRHVVARIGQLASDAGMARFLLSIVCAVALVACRATGEPAVASAVATSDARASVKPGINKDFLDPALDVAKYEERFGGESREIFAQRARIAGLLELREGSAVADVGAGTGLFTKMFATKVGPKGRVYGVDIAPKFIEHLRDLAKQQSLPQLEAVLCTERSTELPAACVDLVFVCDTYHHFEYPTATLASIHSALRPGGELAIVDFHREPGVSRPWILEHVRAGRDVVQQEVEAAGFQLVRVEATPFLRENYMMRFRKP